MPTITQKPNRGHNPICVGLPDEPCSNIVNTKTDYPVERNHRGVMSYRCRTCEEKRVIRDVRKNIAAERPKAIEQ